MQKNYSKIDVLAIFSKLTAEIIKSPDIDLYCRAVVIPMITKQMTEFSEGIAYTMRPPIIGSHYQPVLR